jgi:adenylate cyclase
MNFSKGAYLAPDRLHALASNTMLPETADGSALLADISGFTPATEQLRLMLGARRGAEELAVHLNRVYDTLIAVVDRHDGSIIGFAGDAITCWFGGDTSAEQATACGFALLAAMAQVEHVVLPEGPTLLLGLKIAITSGTARRLAVGDSDIQLMDVLTGTMITKLAIGEELAERGEILVDSTTVNRLGDTVEIRAWRDHSQGRFAALDSFAPAAQPPLSLPTEDLTLADNIVSPWILPALRAGVEAFPIELRPVTALFVGFSGIDFDDLNVHDRLDRFVKLAQQIVTGYAGNVLQLTIGDKGSYLYAAFGAPFAHEDDPARALNAAIDLREQAEQLGYLDPLRIGISRGIMRTGAYGGVTRRTYGVLGDEVNLAARLMSISDPGTILISDSMLTARLDHFTLQSLSLIQVKGKSQPVRVFQVVGRRDHSFEQRFYTTPLVGRDDVLQQIGNALVPILQAKHAGLIYIHGQAGMGKSRLAFEAQQRLQAQANVTWVIGQADQLSLSPLSAFVYFLRPFFGQRRENDSAANLAAFDEVFNGLLAFADESNRADLLLYRSFLAGLAGVHIPSVSYESIDEKLRIDNQIAAIKSWARAECRRQPLVIQLEDVQWLDASSLRTVQQLTYNIEDVPLSIVLTSRHNDDGTFFSIPDIYSVPVHVVDLNRLSDIGVQSIAEAVLRGEISDRLAQLILERAEGNPFFTEQLVLDLKERGVLIQIDMLWNLQPDATAEVPSSVNAVLIARLDRLAARVKGVVQTASVLGREFEVGILSRMLRESDIPAIREAERESIWSGLDEIRYLFRHALLRDAAYAMQAQERLKMLHRLAAETMETLYSDNDRHYDVLLEHWQGAQVADKILHYTVPVCERLVNITADFTRAERFLREALALGNTHSRTILLTLLAEVAEFRGDLPTAIAYYQDALNSPDIDVTLQVRTMNGLGNVYLIRAELEKVTDIMGRALTLAREHQEQLGTARALSTLGSVAYQQGDYPTARAHHEESLQLYRELNLLSGIVTCLNNLAGVATVKGDIDEARQYLDQCLLLARQVGDRQRVSNVLNALGNLAIHEGNFVAARRYYEEGLTIKRDIGARLGIGNSLANLAIVAVEQGNLEEGHVLAEASLRERRAIDNPRGIANSLILLASVAGYRNEYAVAQQYMEEALEIQRDINDRWAISTTLYNLSELELLKGEYSQAQRYAEECLALARELEQPWNIGHATRALGKIAFEQNEQTRARQLYQEAFAIYEGIKDQQGTSICLIYLGMLDMQISALLEAERQLGEAVVILRSIDDHSLSLALAVFAEVKQKLGQPQEIVYSVLREALSIAQIKDNLSAKHTTLLASIPILLAEEMYSLLGELIGLLRVQAASYADQAAVNRALEDLRPHVDPLALSSALERGQSLDLADMIARLLSALT